MKFTKQNISTIGWILAMFVVIVSSIVWLEGIGWDISKTSGYRLFPLLGLIAFGLMWTHYIVAAIKKVTKSKQSTSHFFEVTSIVVLALILLHPGILIFSLWRDGFGLPPNSYLNNYVQPSLKWAALLGSVSLVVFLVYELRRWLKDKDWWKFVQYASDVAMIAILIHGFKLGNHLESGWFLIVWVFYTVTLIASLFIIYSYKPVEVSHE